MRDGRRHAYVVHGRVLGVGHGLAGCDTGAPARLRRVVRRHLNFFWREAGRIDGRRLVGYLRDWRLFGGVVDIPSVDDRCV